MNFKHEKLMKNTIVAKVLGFKIIDITGIEDGELAKVSNRIINVLENGAYMVQKLYLQINHCFCLMQGERIFGGNK